MQEGMARFEQFLVTIPAGVIMAICFLLIVYKMIDGEIPGLPGMVALTSVLVMLWFCVWPPHPALPAVILVSVIALMVTFPFAERVLQDVEQREYDVSRLERAFGALQQKYDNPSAMFEAAKWLHVQGFHADAIAIGEATLAMLSTKRDDVKNVSMRDHFRAEEQLVMRWKRSPIGPVHASAYVCPACKTSNVPGTLFCAGCRRPYLLDRVKSVDLRARFWGRLILTWGLIGATVAGGAAIGLTFTGPLRWVVLGVALLVIGLLLTILFRPPRPTRGDT